MKSVTFSPGQQNSNTEDRLSSTLMNLARYIFLAGLAVMPLFFIPSVSAPFGYSKILLVTSVIILASIFYTLAVLRSGILRVQPTVPTLFLWGVVITTSLSAIFSQNVADSFAGPRIGTQSVVFVALLALIVTTTQFLINSKKLVMKMYLLLSAVAVLLGIHHLLRLFFGPELLSFGIGTTKVFSLIGGWNDAGIFFGLIVLLSLLAVEQLSLPKISKVLFFAVSLLSLLMLAVIQFTAVWILLGFVAIISLLYALTRNRFEKSYRQVSSSGLTLSAIISVLAISFIIAGGAIGSYINKTTDINYIEVRPSVSSTLNVAKEIYSQDALLGTGPNQFLYTWREHKNPAINNTVFWNTDFNAGNGYLPTIFATTGGLNTVLWIAFFISFLFVGYRMLIQTKGADRFWYFVASSSFIASVYLWIMAAIYLPGPAILMFAALCTGIALVSYTNVTTVQVYTFNSLQNKRATILLVAGVLMVTILLITSLYALATHYSAAYTFNQGGAALTNGELEKSNSLIQRAYSISPHDSYIRRLSQNHLVRLRQLLALNEFSEEDQAEFQAVFEEALVSSQQAISDNPHDAKNWALRASVYATVAGRDAPGATTRALEALEEAKRRAPRNPEYYVMEAQIAFRNDNIDKVYSAVEKALQLKQNYVPAISLLTELEVSEGNIDNAIGGVRALLRLEPNNSGRYYQLGLLLLNKEQQQEAIASLEKAIELDNDFSNARYLLALQYADMGRTEDALSHLRHVQKLNPDSEMVAEKIRKLEAGETIVTEINETEEITDEITPNPEDGAVQTKTPTENDIVTPVNSTQVEEVEETTTSEPTLENTQETE